MESNQNQLTSQVNFQLKAEPRAQRGIILLNLGTPKEPRPADVKVYLKEFLMDPMVLDIPFPLRWILVNALILPKRSISSAEAYQKVWTERGSPLRFHLLDLTEYVQKLLGESWVVQAAMRYGEPSVAAAFSAMYQQKIRDITVLPLYPQYSLAATQSSIQKCLEESVLRSRNLGQAAQLKFVKPFYSYPSFIEAFVKVAQASLKDYNYDHLLMSFHGLPERHVRRTDLTGEHCLKTENCCLQITSQNQNCYRAQCYATARLIAEGLGLESAQYSVCFQSRLGNTPWIRPFTDQFYRDLPKRGVKRLAVACPSFVADCLETLEEVQIRGREEFIQNGGEDLKLIPSLNFSTFWAESVSQLVQDSQMHESHA